MTNVMQVTIDYNMCGMSPLGNVVGSFEVFYNAISMAPLHQHPELQEVSRIQHCCQTLFGRHLMCYLDIESSRQAPFVLRPHFTHWTDSNRQILEWAVFDATGGEWVVKGVKWLIKLPRLLEAAKAIKVVKIAKSRAALWHRRTIGHGRAV
jgi:hypothetical protein